MQSDRFLSWALFILLCIIWGSSFILMQWSSEGLTASQIASVRIFSAGLVLLPFGILHFKKIPARKLGLVILSAVFGNLLPAYLFAIAIAKSIDSSLAGILNSLTPIFVVLIGWVFYKAKAGPMKILGIVIGFAGLCILTLAGNKGISFENIGYAFLILLGTILYGINVNMVSYQLHDINPVYLTTVSLSFMMIPTGAALWLQDFFTLPFEESVVKWSVIASAFLGVVGSALATALFYILLKKAGGLFASLVTYGIPFIAIFWGLIYGENITWLQILCLGIILFGVYLANYKKYPEKIKQT